MTRTTPPSWASGAPFETRDGRKLFAVHDNYWEEPAATTVRLGPFGPWSDPLRVEKFELADLKQVTGAQTLFVLGFSEDAAYEAVSEVLSLVRDSEYTPKDSTRAARTLIDAVPFGASVPEYRFGLLCRAVLDAIDDGLDRQQVSQYGVQHPAWCGLYFRLHLATKDEQDAARDTPEDYPVRPHWSGVGAAFERLESYYRRLRPEVIQDDPLVKGALFDLKMDVEYLYSRMG